MSPEVADLLRQQEVLRRFIESISGELKLRPLLTRIVRHACELIGADHGSIGLVDDERQVVRTEATYRMPPSELGSEMAPGVGLAGQVYLTKQPLVLDRYGEVEHPTQPGLLDHAVIGLPIFWHGHMIGFCGIGADAPRRFSAQDVKTLSVFARHAAVAIENARRYEREQRRIERLALIARIGRIVTADLMLDDLLQRAADAIHDLLGYPNIGIALIFPEDPHTLVIRTLGGHYRNILRGEYRQSVAEGILGAAVRERRVLLINDVEADPRYIRTPGSSGIVAELAVPILLADRVLGVLNVESPGPFTDEDAASLEIIADQLAVAIENARLFSRVKDALDETKLLYDTSRRIGAALDVDEVVAVYLEQMAVHGRYPCVVALHEPDGASEPDGAPRHRWWLRGRWTPQRGIEYLSQPFPYPGQTLDELLDAGQVVTIADAGGDPQV
ncbi:MAG TPA: GAF domain-containing protein, partial [Chloroflexota bacterium]|nr:GAF domain-containing protein [Chloroflexota bacterium]